MKIILKTIKFLLSLCCAGIIIALILTVWTSRDPSSVAKMAWTENALAAYESDPEYFAVTGYKGFEDRNYSQDSRFGYSRTIKVNDIDQWQVLIRYNDAVLKELDASRPETDFEAGERFVFTLEDDLGNIYTEYSYVWEKTSRHTFVRLIFDGVKESFVSKAEDGTSSVSRISELRLNVYCREDVKDGVYPERAEAFMYIWGDGTGIFDYDKFKKDMPKDKKPTDRLCSSAALNQTESKDKNNDT